MAEGSAKNSEAPVSLVSAQLARLIRGNRDAILTSFEEYLKRTHSPTLDIECAKKEVMATASEVITDIAESVAAGHVRVDEYYKLRSWALGEAMARTHLSPADSLLTAAALFKVAVTSLISWASEDPDFLPAFVIAILALHESSTQRIREATLAYTGLLLNRIHHAHLDERYRIARELHDQLGEGLGAALRQLELDELINDRRALPLPAALAKQSIVEGMRRLRLVISDLRHDPVTSLEKALTSYVNSIYADADVQLRVSGDESWVPPVVIDETYTLLREALRNALKHAAPRLVLIRVDLTPFELRASVEDDGCGFVPVCDAEGAFGRTGGLASMHERANLIGGRLRILSEPGNGTRVELLVKLPELRDGPDD